VRILGFDPGTAIVGWGMVLADERQASRLSCEGYGVITTHKDLPHNKRLLAVYQGVQALLQEHQPEVVAIERLFASRNVTTVMTVSQARGVILLACEQAGIPTVELTPQQVKQGLTGYGKAEKKQVQEMAQRVLQLPQLPKPDDAADALAVAVTAVDQVLLERRLAQIELRAR
jgi:crossover junction endodeoxyribonuclease RuvC